jgi:hypothetical protein
LFQFVLEITRWQECKGGDRTPDTHYPMIYSVLALGDRSVGRFGKSDGICRIYSLFITTAGLILAAFRVCPIKVAKEIDVIPS